MDRKMTKEEFDKWVLKVNDDFENDKSAQVYAFGRRTFVFHKSNPEKVGMSICSEEDSFNHSVGLAIAYTRYNRGDIPKIYKTICEQLEKLKYNEQFIFREQRYIYMCQHPVFSEFEIVCYEINTGKFVAFPRELVVEKIKED